MLFLSYHQLHSRPTEAGAPPRRREEEGAPSGGFRMSVRSVLSLALFQRRPEAVPAEGKATTLHERDAGEEVKPAAAAADANKELERKFEEALRLSCWSS